MSSYSVNTLVRDVRIAIDNNESSTPLVGISDTDQLSVDTLVRSMVLPAARLVLSQCSPLLIDNWSEMPQVLRTGLTTGTPYKAIVTIPNFFRLGAFTLGGWRGAPEYIECSDPRYQQLCSKWGGVGGTKNKPVVVFVPKKDGSMVLEIYDGGSGGSTVRSGGYLPNPSISGDNIDLPSKLYDAVVLMCGSLVCNAVGDADLGKALLSHSQELMNIKIE